MYAAVYNDGNNYGEASLVLCRMCKVKFINLLVVEHFAIDSFKAKGEVTSKWLR